jgi:hypothetical protein
MMQRRLPRCVVACQRRQQHSGSDDDGTRWSRGDGGYDWKQRHLTEKRSLAMDFMFDVSKRTPIHDGVRLRAKHNEDRLRGVGPTAADGSASQVLVDSLISSDDGVDDDADDVSDADISTNWEDMISEGAGDSLRYLPARDVRALAAELYGEAAADSEERQGKMVAEWFKLRRDTSPYQGYTAMPKQERNAWSAWYLRDVR